MYFWYKDKILPAKSVLPLCLQIVIQPWCFAQISSLSFSQPQTPTMSTHDFSPSSCSSTLPSFSLLQTEIFLSLNWMVTQNRLYLLNTVFTFTYGIASGFSLPGILVLHTINLKHTFHAKRMTPFCWDAATFYIHFFTTCVLLDISVIPLTVFTRFQRNLYKFSVEQCWNSSMTRWCNHCENNLWNSKSCFDYQFHKKYSLPKKHITGGCQKSIYIVGIASVNSWKSLL